ncbi:MAG: DUF1080 domain-containing protein [Bacteroidales bacterium]|nr:DUF1080 domain-containing protein [Bacteroidales bacterium]
MKRFTISIIALLLAAFTLSAQQDARNRSVDTIVSDVLAAMPAQTNAEFESNMKDLLDFAPASIKIVGERMTAAAVGANSKMEYAISGAVAYASAHPEYKTAAIQGLESAIYANNHAESRQFLQSQLRLLQGSDIKVQEPVPSKQLKACEVVRAMRSADRSERVQALYAAPESDALYAKLAKCRKAEGADADILYFLGERKAAGQIDYIISKIGGEYSADAETAAAKIGGTKAAKALCAIPSDALLYFNGKFADELMAETAGASPEKLAKILDIASARHLTQFADLAFANKDYEALKGVVKASDGPRLAALVNSCSEQALPAVLAAYTKAASETDDFQATVAGDIAASADPVRFFKPYAATNSDAAAEYLSTAMAEGSKEAAEALKTIDNPKAADALLKAAAGDESFLAPYVALVKKYGRNAFELCEKYTGAMALAKSVPVKKAILNAMSDVKLPQMLTEVDKHLGDAGVEHDAALAAKKLLAACEASMDDTELRRIAERTIAVFDKTRKTDDEYAIKEINTILDQHKVYPVSTLTEEEKAQGFEMLYDGTDLDKWIGDKTGYTSVNGVINVTAAYGLSSGNLYTAKEYRNFIYRFEFVFLEPAVNNGVGIRTPMGVDAAYDGMCECQILDHDDPVYANLREYQVHGSAYGVIPATRVVHKPVGEWNCEEIEVRGNHIKVTLNGVVINEGDLKEACQGHNVAPDGSNHNPYTIDHRNHPGMFNHKGHISFCGHGKGLQFRNVRILDLGEED